MDFSSTIYSWHFTELVLLLLITLRSNISNANGASNFRTFVREQIPKSANYMRKSWDPKSLMSSYTKLISFLIANDYGTISPKGKRIQLTLSGQQFLSQKEMLIRQIIQMKLANERANEARNSNKTSSNPINSTTTPLTPGQKRKQKTGLQEASSPQTRKSSSDKNKNLVSIIPNTKDHLPPNLLAWYNIEEKISDKSHSKRIGFLNGTYMDQEMRSFYDLFCQICYQSEDIELTEAARLYLSSRELEILNTYLTYRNKIKQFSSILYGIECNHSGFLCLPWDYVDFGNGYLDIKHPSSELRPIRLSKQSSREDFNILKTYLKEVCNFPEVICEKGKITHILNSPIFENCIQILIARTPSPKIDVINRDSIPTIRTYSVSGLRKSDLLKKSRYLQYIIDHIHLYELNVYYCLERRINSCNISEDEYAFIFTSHHDSINSTLVFENTNDSRATIIFNVQTHKLNEAIDAIHSYFSSNIVNKRRQICNKNISFTDAGILSYHRIIHEEFESWRRCINTWK